MADTNVLYKDSRIEKFWVEVLDDKERFLTRLDGVTGGDISCSTDARIKRGGSLNLVMDKPRNWWGKVRLKVWVEVNGYPWSLGVFIPSSPEQEHDSAGVKVKVDIHDKLLIWDDDKLPAALTIPKGTNLIGWIKKEIAALGEKEALTPSTIVNKRPLVWDAATEKLTVFNDILDYCGYFSLTVTPDGVFTSTPYVLPKDRPVTWVFTEGDGCLLSVDYTYTQDLTGIPNRIVYTTSPQEEGKQPLVSSWENHDRNSPYSFENRGRWITDVKTDAEAASQKELDKMVARRVHNAQSPMRRIEISSALLPVALNQIVRFTTTHYKLMMSVRKFEMSLRPGSLMKMTLRGVNREYI